VTKVPHGHWKTLTFLAALRHDRVDAPWLLDGPIDGESFKTYVEKVLVPTLKPGDIVIQGQLSARRGHPACGARQPQEKGHSSSYPVGRRQAVLLAQIFTRPEPH
jgi:hypothetical protein